MFNLLVYGSLLDRAERSKQGLEGFRTTPVVVAGFQRSFNQEPAWRLSSLRARAVLAVRERLDCSFNALLVSELSEDQLGSLDQRERGYNRVTVEASRISAFHGGQVPQPRFDTYVYCGKPEYRNDLLLPNDSYMNLCVGAAAQWGRAFQNEFLRSTFTAGEPTFVSHGVATSATIPLADVF